MYERKTNNENEGGNMSYKQYMGDSVYAAFDGVGLKLTTENGFGASNTIYIEPEVLGAINRYWEYCVTQTQTKEEYEKNKNINLSNTESQKIT